MLPQRLFGLKQKILSQNWQELHFGQMDYISVTGDQLHSIVAESAAILRYI